MTERVPGDGGRVSESGLLQAVQAAKAAGRAEGFEEGRAMAEAASMKPAKRWTDHWQVKFMMGLLGFVGVTAAGGGGWIVNDAIAGGKKDVEQDGRIKAVEDQFDQVLKALEKQDAKLEDIRREVKK